MHAFFNRFTIKLTKDQALNASHPGPCDQDVECLLSLPTVRRQLDKIPAADIKAELSEYGAWDDDELADHDANRARIIWIAARNIREEAE